MTDAFGTAAPRIDHYAVKVAVVTWDQAKADAKIGATAANLSGRKNIFHPFAAERHHLRTRQRHATRK